MPVQPATTTKSEKFIPVSEFIRRAKERGVNFGFGDPYNRLRYYTKIGLLPHMTRRAVEWNEATVGHYPESALDTLEKIEDLKKRNLSNIEIEEKLEKERIEVLLEKTPLDKLEARAPQISTRISFAWVGAFVLALVLLGTTALAGLSPLHRTRLARAVRDFKENAITNLVAIVLPQLADQINGKIPEIIDVNDILSYDKDGNLVVLSHKISVPVLRSTVKKGQAPLEVDSDTKVKDLNADLLDGHDTGTGPGNIPFLDEAANLVLETASGVFDSLQALGRNIFGPSEFKGDVDVEGNMDVNQKLTVSGNAVVSSTLAIGSAGTQTYNLIADAVASASGAMDSDLDLYIQEDLEVDGTAYLSGLASSGNLTISNANPTLTFEDTTAGDDGWNINVDDDSFYIYNVNDTTNYLTIDGGGSVGIGTTNPSTTLHISATDGLVIPVGTTAQRPGSLVSGIIRYNTNTSQFEGYGSSNWGSLGGVIDVDQDTYINAETSPGADNDELRFFTAGTERVRIDSSGNLGIGTTGPSTALDVVGTITASNGLTVSAGTVSLPAGEIDNTELANSSVSYGGISVSLGGSDATPAFDLSDATSLPIVVGTTGTLTVARGGTGATTLTDHGVLVGSDTGAITPLAVGTDGQILIGSTGNDPSWGTIGAASVTDDSLDFSEFVDAMTLDALTKVDLNSFDFGFYGTGNVGIGTTSPAVALEIGGGGNVRIDGLTATRAVFSDASKNLVSTGTSAALSDAVSDEEGSGALVFATSPSLTTPSLGVATATSINKVALTAPASGSTLTIADGKTLIVSHSLTLAGSDATTLTFQGTDTYVGRATTDSLTNKTLTDSSNVLGGVTMTLGSDATGDIYYLTGGVLTRLGIGTATQVLHGGTTPSYSAIAAADITDDSLDFSEFVDAMTLDASTKVDLNSQNFSFWNTGNVGIGTTGPTSKLSVAGGVGIGTTAPGSVYHSTATAPDGGLIVETSIGVGTTNPAYTMEVIGNGRFSTDLTVSGGDILGVAGEEIDLGEATADTITFTVGTAAELILDGNKLAASTGGGLDLGGSSNQFADLYLQGGNINLDNATDIDIDDATASALTISEGGNNYLLITTTNNEEAVTLDLPAGGGTSLTGNLFTSNIDKTINLGTGTGVDTINIGIGATGADVIAIGSSNAGNVTIDSATTIDLSAASTGTIGLNTANGTITLDTSTGSNQIQLTAGSGEIDLTTTGTVDVNSGSFDFSYAASGGTFTLTDGDERLRIDDDGSLILGDDGATTTIDGSTITFSGSTVLTSSLDLDGNQLILDPDGGMYLQAAVNDKLAIMGGSVGVGTTDPAYTMEVIGDGRFSTNLTVSGGTLSVPSATTIDLATADVGSTINIATEATTADSISIGNSHTDSTLALTGGDDWSMAATGFLTMSASAGQTTAIIITDTDYTNALSIGDNKIIGTTAAIDFDNFDLATTGHMTVQPAYGLDVNAGGELKLGDTTATTVSIGTTAATALNIGDAALTTTIDIGGVTADGTTTINIATNNTSADVVTIGSTHASSTLALNSGDWTISTTGVMAGIGNITTDGNITMSTDDAWIGVDASNERIIFDQDGDDIELLVGNVGIGGTAPASLLSVGVTSQFQVDTSGDIVKLKNLTYSWPSSQTINTVLMDTNGSGTLSWTTIGAASITDDSLDWADFTDTMTLDATTSINIYDGSADVDLRFYNSNDPAEVLFLDGSTNFVGIGTTGPSFKLDVNGDIRVQGGELYITPLASSASTTEGTIYYDTDDNLYVYANGAWVDLTVQGGAGLWTDQGSFIYADNYSSFVITDTGSVGIGTTGPDDKLHIATSSQSDDLLQLEVAWAAENDVVGILFAGGATDYGGAVRALAGPAGRRDLVLYANNAGDNSVVEIMRLQGDGNVGIGTTGPGTRLNIQASGFSTFPFRINASDGDRIFEVYNDSDGDAYSGYYDGSDNVKIRFHSNGNSYFDGGNVGIGTTDPGHDIDLGGGTYADAGAAWTDGSDIRFKRDINDITYGLSEVLNLRPISYVYEQEATGATQLGFIAQDIQAIMPELVGETHGYLSLAYGRFAPVLANAIQEQQGEIEEMRGELAGVIGVIGPMGEVLAEHEERIEENESQISNLKDQIHSSNVKTEETDEETLEATESASPELGSDESELSSPPPELSSIEPSSDPGEPKLEGYEELTIKKSLEVLGSTSLFDLTVAGQTMFGANLVIDELGESIDTLVTPLKLQSKGGWELEMMAGKVVVDTEGNLHLKEGVLYANDQMRDATTVSAGAPATTIARNWSTNGGPPVSVTATPSWNTTVWVVDLTEKGFTIHFGTPPTESEKVYWFAVW